MAIISSHQIFLIDPETLDSKVKVFTYDHTGVHAGRPKKSITKKALDRDKMQEALGRDIEEFPHHIPSGIIGCLHANPIRGRAILGIARTGRDLENRRIHDVLRWISWAVSVDGIRFS